MQPHPLPQRVEHKTNMSPALSPSIVLEISREAFRELRSRLQRAGCGHLIEGDTIDLRQIALRLKPLTVPVSGEAPVVDRQGRPHDTPEAKKLFRSGGVG